MHVVVFFLPSWLLRVGIDVHSARIFLGMQPLTLFEHDERNTRRQDRDQHDQPGHEPRQTVRDDEAYDGSSCCARRPVDVAALNAHELQRALQPLEQRVVGITFVLGLHHTSGLTADTEEQRQSLSRSDKENTCAHDHHDLLLDILLLVVHGDIDADRAHNRNDPSDGVAEFDDDGYILGDFLRIVNL